MEASVQKMQIRRPKASEEVTERERYLSALNQAQAEYNVALSCFGEAVEPEIIDEAIFLMEAARRKYSYFLKKVRDGCGQDTGCSPAAIRNG